MNEPGAFRWNGASPPPGDDQQTAIPLLLYAASGRAAVISPASNWMLAVHDHSLGGPGFGAGVKASVATLPPGFVHETVIVGGEAPGAAMDNLGDALRALSGKPRTDAYGDFVLSHLGYWADYGAYYYHTTNGFNNHEDALLAVQARATNLSIPFRYYQWDDWFPIENGDQPGTLFWWPRAEEIPSGMTDWLAAPTSLYSSMWSDKNVYQQAGLYKWATDESGSVLPVDVSFFRDIFHNGSVARMRMFEQDFLCTYAWNTNLTTRDPLTGMQWLHAMDQAAGEAGIGLQLCMVTPLHALAATELGAVTNIRGSNDNMHADAGYMYSLGQNGLLLRGLGMFVARDNVFTSPHEPGCGGSENCTSPDYQLQNVAAMLAGGPYGPSDGVDFLNASMIARSCRPDGVLLRADRTFATSDAALLDEAAFASVRHQLLWQTYCEYVGRPGF